MKHIRNKKGEKMKQKSIYIRKMIVKDKAE